MDKTLDLKYQECINEFVTNVSNLLKNELQVIILHGGLVRDISPIKYWSDIDLILLFKQYSTLITKYLSKTVNEFENRFNLRLDINLVYQYDLKNDFYKAKYYNSEIINALNQRNIRILYGSLDTINSNSFNEKEAVYVYLNSTQNLFRRYYIENIYRNLDSNNCKVYLQRIIRWIFSIIRSSLRLYNIYVNPYQESLAELKKINILPQKNILLIEKLILIRADFDKLDTTNIADFLVLFADIEDFVEYYINVIIGNFSTLD